MKKSLCVVLLLCALSGVAAAEQGYLSGTNAVELAEGESLTVLCIIDPNMTAGATQISISLDVPPYYTSPYHTVLIRTESDLASRTMIGPCRVLNKNSNTTFG